MGDNAFWPHNVSNMSCSKRGSKAGYWRKARIESKRIKAEIRPRLEERKEWRKRGRKEVGETHVQHGFLLESVPFLELQNIDRRKHNGLRSANAVDFFCSLMIFCF